MLEIKRYPIETAPKDGSWFWGYDGREVEICWRKDPYGSEGWYAKKELCHPTHWRSFGPASLMPE